MRVFSHALLGVTHVAIPVKLFTDEEAACLKVRELCPIIHVM